MKEQIEIPIYFTQDDKGNITIVEEDMRNDFENKLMEVKENPKNFLEVC